MFVEVGVLWRNGISSEKPGGYRIGIDGGFAFQLDICSFLE